MAGLYSLKDIQNAYQIIQEHMQTKKIIQEHAINRQDIREVALDSLDLSKVEQVLDLGCGYGFFTEKLRGRLKEGAHILGIDLVDRQNREVFLKTVDEIGYRGEFIHSQADIIKDMDGSRFDLVIASYSLYFFPHLIPDIARVLSPGGIFITVTHSRHSLKEVTELIPRCIEIMGLTPPQEITINRLFQSFCMENGEEQLTPFFEKVDRILYRNDLLFSLDRISECIDYLDKKRHLIFKDVMESHPQKMKDVVSSFHAMILELAKERGRVVLTKDDAVFRCFSPRRGV
ncbi:MAG TPA: class I SAM-dependent methyltransferase [Deltaproteobacteria bacterium]|nr:class I SAM-dependent methyltransferase [Deltaproteobacteria bacterium]